MMLSLFLVHAALATGITFDEVPCPLGGAPARRFHKIAANRAAGYDSDLVSYSTKGQFRTHAISTCPDSLYSVYGDHLERPVTDVERPAVEAALAKVRKTLVDPDNPEVWERYVIAAHVYEALGHDSLDIAQVYIEASWVARDEAVGVYVGGLNGPKAAQQVLTMGAAELAKPLPEDKRRTVLYSLARVSHRAGYPDHRRSYLKQFAALGPSAEEATQAARFETIAEEIEPALQAMAIEYLRAGLQTPDRSPMQSAQASYMLADLLRRTGHSTEALPLYQQVVKSDSTPKDILVMASFFVAELAR
jgi:tetratricopeptide (TPR) repeat protein